MRVLIDANVLYPTVMREIVLGCAAAGLFQARWTERIEEEWARATRRLGPEAEAVARGEIAALSLAFPDARVRGWEGREGRLWLPDPDDVHVLAAAIHGSCDAILTQNAQDFPKDALAAEGLVRLDPDGFLRDLWAREPEVVQRVAEQVVEKARALSGEAWTVRRLLKKARLNRLGRALDPA
ncbi:RSP_2648 family PIN domain-containing protein [Wenxinia marina]|uniref:PIN domain protein n=1 Tax=Wenxinia marina DSM 24838 TaxID=1123501 RepID=A0A0D0PEB7_9RHOB|nr:PIN domain-containing protein [Wenxinia marina]KIQ69731.1 PIN domain protein [Wenxinia marina DSM 24838]GGL60780.1 PIN domain-containing protein [Wenxinia marina]